MKLPQPNPIPPTWQVSIDTGGTFTDCIAIPPGGRETIRVKVLSSSALRGTLTGKTGKRQFRFATAWGMEQDIFGGYFFKILTQCHAPNLAGFPKRTPSEQNPRGLEIRSIDFSKKTLTLSGDLDFPLVGTLDFEITAGEEAPILAARLATRTPLNEPLPPLHLRLGTTKATNALLEGKGARTALIVTKGFGDLLVIGTQQRPQLFELNIPQPRLLYHTVLEANERLGAQGQVIQALTGEEVRRLVQKVKASDAETVAIALLHSYRNPNHENQICAALQAAGISSVSVSSALSPAIQILSRATTAVANACLAPILENYLNQISEKLSPGSSLLVMTSAGSLLPFQKINGPRGSRTPNETLTFQHSPLPTPHSPLPNPQSPFHPKDSLLSGPAGGVIGAAAIARRLGIGRILAFDMGGTSTDTARVEDDKFDYQHLTRVGDIELQLPSIAIETVAAGGGSVCRFDGARLIVGPESAGATPGPACYGAGGPLTVTDVNLLLGKLAPEGFGIPLRPGDAAARLSEVQLEIFEKTGETLSLEAVLRGFEKIADEKMASAIRRISVAKGFDPKDYSLLAFGGAGGLHACAMAGLLDIGQIVVPMDGGLLSAFGIGEAQVERWAQRQVLKPLAACILDFQTQIEEVAQEAKKDLLANDPDYTAFVYLRFLGQDSTLELSWRGTEFLEKDFENQYRRLFGHFPKNKVVEVESIRIRAFSEKTQEQPAPGIFEKYQPNPENQPSQNGSPKTPPLFFWEKLTPGATIPGPAILAGKSSTVFIERDWHAEIQPGGDGIIRNAECATPAGLCTPHSALCIPQAIQLELFTNRFAAIAEEMGAQLRRTAFSVNIKERLDFSCALLDAEGELLVNAPHIPVHLGSLGVCLRAVRERMTLGPGDVAITNHPGFGGSHLPDVTLLAGVYTPENELIGYVANRAHHAEIGGKRTGSMPPDATRLEEEGVVIPPTYLLKGGEILWEEMERLLTKAPYPTRALPENLADINAALASLRTGEQALLALAQTHGRELVQHYAHALKDLADESLQAAMKIWRRQSDSLASIETITFAAVSAQEKLDDGHCIRVAIRIGEELEFDFSGTSPTHPFNLNANRAIVHSAVMYVLRTLCATDLPLNEGLMRRVRIHLPECFLNPCFFEEAAGDSRLEKPRFAPAVVGGNTEVSQRLVDTLFKAFGTLACSQGTMNNFLFGNERFGYYETIGGGAGAGPGFDGRSGVHTHMTNTKITDPEVLEFRYPVRLREFSIRRGSGGKGRWQGGDGIVREMEFLEPMDVTLLSQHRKEKPYGMAGGKPGKPGNQWLITKDGTKEKLDGIVSLRVEAGERIRIETPGGGGYGVMKLKFFLLLLLPLFFKCQNEPDTLLIQNVKIMDGSGEPGFEGAVRIRGDQIVEVGKLQPRRGEPVVDGNGKVLAPGFIDTHSHHDRDMFRKRHMPEVLSQGITTIIIGQDGFSRYPLREFWEKFDSMPAPVNVASFIGHNTLREKVLGENYKRKASSEEVAAMQKMLTEELPSGALGLSAGLEYEPGLYSDTSEVMALAGVAGKAGKRYIAHIRSEEEALWAAIDETIRIGARWQMPVQISHSKIGLRSEWGKASQWKAKLDSARAAGVRISADVYPYEYWQSTIEVIMPDRNFDNMAEVRKAFTERVRPEDLLIANFEADTTLEGKTLARIAADRQQEPAKVYVDLVRQAQASGKEESVICTAMSPEDIAAIFGWSHSNLCTDGSLNGTHPRGAGSFPRAFRKWVREEKHLSAEACIQKFSGSAAVNMGIEKRGLIKPGYFADLVLFDPAVLTDHATTLEPGLFSEGIEKVWVNGKLVWEGKFSGAFPGQKIF